MILLRDHTFMTSMKNVQFLQHPPPPPFSVYPNGSELGKTLTTPGRGNLGYQPLSTTLHAL